MIEYIDLNISVYGISEHFKMAAIIFKMAAIYTNTSNDT